MLRASLLANAEILPQARQGSYFFNRIGQKRSSSQRSSRHFDVLRMPLNECRSASDRNPIVLIAKNAASEHSFCNATV